MTRSTPSAVNMTRAIGYGSGGFNMMFRVYTEIGEQMSTYRGLAMIIVGLAPAVFARPDPDSWRARRAMPDRWLGIPQNLPRPT